MTIDVTNNAQYVALQKSYDQQIDRDQQLQDGASKLGALNFQLAGIDERSPNWESLNNQKKTLEASLQALDPDGSVRKALAAGTEKIDDVKSQEADALDTLETVLIGQDAIQQAHDAAAQATGAASKSDGDIMTRVMLTFAMLGQADEKVVAGQMDAISGNVDKITQLNSLSEAVRSARPTGTDGNATKQLSADVVKQLQALGVQLPDVKPDAGGQTYT